MLASATGPRGRSPSMHPPCIATHHLLTNRSLLDDLSNSKRILILLGKYSRRFQNPRGDSDVDWGQTCVFVSILHHRSSGAGGRIGGCKWALLDGLPGGIASRGKVECMTVGAGLQGCFWLSFAPPKRPCLTPVSTTMIPLAAHL